MTGSPLSAEGFVWIYAAVKQDVWLSSVSGGTDICSGFVGGVPTLPVRAGEIQARLLGVAAYAYGDYIEILESGACIISGRSDSTLNRFGIRIGTAEIYRVLDKIEEIQDALIVNLDLPGGKFYMPLFVLLKEDAVLNDVLKKEIRTALRSNCSPRHVPDEIYAVDQIPITLTGKKLEVPVKKILMGVPVEKAANPGAMANPASLDYFVTFAKKQ